MTRSMTRLLLRLLLICMAAVVTTASVDDDGDDDGGAAGPSSGPIPARPHQQRRTTPSIHPGQRYQDCGGIFTEPRGFFKTPNFPDPFPVPISCRWVIEAPRGRTILIHFTQFYLREGVRAKAYTDYDKFWGRTDVYEHDLGAVSADNRATRLVSGLPFLVLDLEVHDLTNTNLRVLDSLMDVYGFNVTYEVVDTTDLPPPPPPPLKGASSDLTSGSASGSSPSSSPSYRFREACSAPMCRFNGNCLGSADLERYWCQCFPDFFGALCQFGPDCDPERGKTRCLNGGNCSYGIGSRIYACHCPVDFGGDHCEHRQDTFNGNACLSLNCSHLCRRNKSGNFYCDCNPGFRLAADNQTCLNTGLTRYVGSIKLKNASYVPTSLSAKSSTDYVRFKSNIESKLFNVFSSKVKHIKNLTVLEFKSGAVVEFHFFGAENESGLAQESLNVARQLGRIDNVPIDSGYISFAQEPAVDIRTLQVEPRDHLVMGQELRLACVTLGSSALQFHWLKDGTKVDIGSTGSIWQKVLAKNARDEYTAILGIDRVEGAHTGSYTCKVTDWGQTQSRTVKVNVLSRPQVSVSPMSITVNRGDEVSILCLSNVLRSDNFGYNWAKNGVIMGAHDGPEILEDIYPTGSRVKIHSAKYPATYSCVVSGMTGETKVDSRVTVIDPKVIKVCPTEKHLGILWSSSAPNAYDIKSCPVGFEGDVRRRCTKFERTTPSWEEPDFSDCRSHELLKLRFQFDNLRAGFLVTTSADILDKISEYLASRGTDLYPGEDTYVLDFIDDVHQFQDRNSVTQPRLSNGTDVFFDILSQLLTSSNSINSERMIIKLIQAAQRRALFLSRNLVIGQLMRIDKDALAVDMFRRPSSGTREIVVPARRIKRDKTDWTTDSIVARLDFPQESPTGSADPSSVEFAVIVYKNLSRLLPKRFSKKGDIKFQFVDMECEMNSRLVTVAYNSTNTVANETESINLLFNQSSWEVERKGWNVTCGIANLTSGKLEWSIVGCTLITVENVTSCLCTRFGTYVVLLTTFLTSDSEEFRGSLDCVVAIGCFFGLVWVFVTLVCLIVSWRKVFQSFVVLKVHICLGLIGILTTLLVAVHLPLPKSAYPFVVSLLEFFLLVPLSMHVCLQLFLYQELANVEHTQHPITKIALLGWGIPTIVTGATLIFQTQHGFRLERWGMQVGDTYFYGFAISSTILLALYVLLYLIVNLELNYKISSESPQRISASRRMGLLRRCLILQASVTALTITFFVYSNSSVPTDEYRYMFAATCGFTGILVFVLYAINSESPWCLSSKRNDLDSKSSQGTSSSCSRSNTDYPLTVLLDDRPDCPITTTTTRRTKNVRANGRSLYRQHHQPHRRCHRHHCTLVSGDSRETDDLLHRNSDRNHCDSSAMTGKEDNSTRESYLEPVMDDRPSSSGVVLTATAMSIDAIGGGNDLPKLDSRLRRARTPRVSLRRVDISIVDYDGSPKKYPSCSAKGDIEEEEDIDEEDDDGGWPPPPPNSMLSPPPPPPLYGLDGLRPEPVRCYIRCSPEVSSLPRESPTSSATSADISSSSSGLKHAQFCQIAFKHQHHHLQHHHHEHQTPFCNHWPAFDSQSVLVPPEEDVTVTTDTDAFGFRDENRIKANHVHRLHLANSVASSTTNSPSPTTTTANYVNVTAEHRDTVV